MEGIEENEVEHHYREKTALVLFDVSRSTKDDLIRIPRSLRQALLAFQSYEHVKTREQAISLNL
jgi:hypothetical protein